MTKVLNKKTPYILYISCWFFVNLLTLTSYPIMHSDEAWLAGLTRTMMFEKKLLTTEPFFNAAPRAPHSLKVLYHLLQMPFIGLWGYKLFAVRLLSLIFGTISLLLLMKLLKSNEESSFNTLSVVIFITTASQFIYASHFARQEILLTALLLGAYVLYASTGLPLHKKALLSGLLIGLSITLHPNAFFLGLMVGSIYLLDYLSKKASIRTLLLLVMPMAASALLNLGITFSASENFIANYWRYASDLEIGANPASRWINFQNFYVKLYQGISGTYFLTDLRWLFIIFAACTLSIMAALLFNYHRHVILNNLFMRISMPSIVGFNLALFIIGRYNQTSILFLMIPLMLFIVASLKLLLPYKAYFIIMSALILLNLNLSYKDIHNAQWNDYDPYMDFLATHLKDQDRILANLSGGFAMAPDQFLDIRNLAYMDTDILTYLKDNQINTVIWYEEYDYIHRNPNWQILYGDDRAYYDDIKKILEDHSALRAETSSIHYGNRIIRYQDGYPWKIWIYELDDI